MFTTDELLRGAKGKKDIVLKSIERKEERRNLK
jgi:hypothetical protein